MLSMDCLEIQVLAVEGAAGVSLLTALCIHQLAFQTQEVARLLLRNPSQSIGARQSRLRPASSLAPGGRAA